MSNTTQLITVKTQGRAWVDKLLQSDFTQTKPGSITHLLYGAKPSEQSVNIKFGRYGEVLAKELIGCNENIELLKCGVQQINDKKKELKNLKRDCIRYNKRIQKLTEDLEYIKKSVTSINDKIALYKKKGKNPN